MVSFEERLLKIKAAINSSNEDRAIKLFYQWMKEGQLSVREFTQMIKAFK